MTTTKVIQLTGMNIMALREIDIATELGATFALFEGTPRQALSSLDKAISGQRTGPTRRSLMAVRRKLQGAASECLRRPELATGKHNLTDYVVVTVPAAVAAE